MNFSWVRTHWGEKRQKWKISREKSRGKKSLKLFQINLEIIFQYFYAQKINF